jgi:hypothetical protein
LLKQCISLQSFSQPKKQKKAKTNQDQTYSLPKRLTNFSNTVKANRASSKNLQHETNRLLLLNERLQGKETFQSELTLKKIVLERFL